ncbi:PAS domain-containing protein [Dongia sp.]|uniref:PAS domain-containing protein n=1 Tax=Dongia sp. TaxID=1977262 RepID=UPI0035B1E66E
MEQGATSFRDEIAHPRLAALYDYWHARRGPNGAMLRADLEPLDIPKLLACLILSDVWENGHHIRYRLVGSEIAAAHGFDYTGKTIEELTSGTTLDFTRELYAKIVTGGVPVFSEGHFRWEGKEHRWTKRLHLPLSRDGSAIDMVLAGQVFEQKRPDGVERLLVADPATL